jgi:hypothetical protein
VFSTIKEILMKVHEVPVRFSFDGVFKVKAKTKALAEEYVRLHCGMVMGERGVHSSLPEEDIDWDFPIHPEKTILVDE